MEYTSVGQSYCLFCLLHTLLSFENLKMLKKIMMHSNKKIKVKDTTKTNKKKSSSRKCGF